jgi:hypothetical protein
MSKRLATLVASAVGLAVLGGSAFAFRIVIKDAIVKLTRPQLPPAQPYIQPIVEATDTAPVPSAEPAKTETVETPAPKPAAAPTPTPTPTPAPTPAPTPSPTPKPSGVNLAVPFTSQAPYANWELPYQEACEEASLIMADAYIRGVSTLPPEEADRLIKAVVEWQTKRFGYYEDTTAGEVAVIAREFYGLAGTQVMPLESIEDVKKEVAKGNAVLIPAAGRLLKNPYFRGQGPLYHMIVVKGYTTDGQIITNDPGTRRGADFLYDPATLWNAIHDWNGGKVEEGAKVMVVVKK